MPDHSLDAGHRARSLDQGPNSLGRVAAAPARRDDGIAYFDHPRLHETAPDLTDDDTVLRPMQEERTEGAVGAGMATNARRELRRIVGCDAQVRRDLAGAKSLAGRGTDGSKDDAHASTFADRMPA